MAEGGARPQSIHSSSFVEIRHSMIATSFFHSAWPRTILLVISISMGSGDFVLAQSLVYDQFRSEESLEADSPGGFDSGTALPEIEIPSTAPLSNAPLLPAPLLVPGHSPIVRSPCDPDYWIVSSRNCKQQLDCNQNCQFGVYRFDGPGPGRASSLEELYAALPPNVPICFMVHGSFVIWDSMLKDSAETYRWVKNAAPDRPVQMVFFTWPSDDTSRWLPNSIDIADARRSGMTAELNALYLAELISHVPDSNPVCLMGHSHGARMVSAALHLLAGGRVEERFFVGGKFRQQRIRAVLAAAAMDHDWFNPGERYDLALTRAEAMINLRNRHDFPLLFHPTHQIFASRALGRSGLTSLDQRQLGIDLCRVRDCDVTRLIGCRHVWPYYYRQPAIAATIRHYVYFDDAQAARSPQ